MSAHTPRCDINVRAQRRLEPGSCPPGRSTTPAGAMYAGTVARSMLARKLKGLACDAHVEPPQRSRRDARLRRCVPADRCAPAAACPVDAGPDRHGPGRTDTVDLEIVSEFQRCG